MHASNIKKLISIIVVALVFAFSNTFAAQAVVTPSSGPLGGGTVVTVDQLRFTQIAASNPGSFTLGLTSDGTVFAWGDNFYGQLGDGTIVHSTVPVAVKGVGGVGILSNVVAIAAGFEHSVAVTSDGSVYAWGQNNYGQLGNGSNSDSLTPVRVVDNSNTGFLSGVASVSAGSGHTVALTSSGEVFTWGQGAFGQLGNGSYLDTNTPQQVVSTSGLGTTLTGITKIAAGNRYVMAVASSGYLFSWGENSSGQLGDGTTTTRRIPVEVMQSNGMLRLNKVVDVSAMLHTVALTWDGEVYAWGPNWAGQLGNGNTTNSSYPQKVLGIGGIGYLSDIASVAVGALQTFAVTTAGNLVAFGSNLSGQLGDGTYVSQSIPQYVPAVSGPGLLSGVTSVAAGYDYTTSLIDSGKVYSWGGNGFGQFGNGTVTNSATPVLGPNFVPVSVTFDGVLGQGLSSSGSTLTVSTPSHAAGTVPVVGKANLLGGAAIGVPSSVYWNAGTFQYFAVAPTISNPADQNVQAGSSASFSVTATGNPTPTVSWEVSTDGAFTWQSITADSSANVAFDGLSVNVVGTSTKNGWRYRAIASNGASPDAVSSSAVLSISSPVSVATPSPSPSPAQTTAGNVPASTSLSLTGMNTQLSSYILGLGFILVAVGVLVIVIKRKSKNR